MDERLVAEVVHSIEGRTRLRVPAVRGDGAALDAFARRVAALPGVVSVTIRADTASALVRHTIAFPALAQRAERDGVFIAQAAPPAPPGAALQALVSKLAPRTRSDALAIAFAGLGMFQLFQQRVLPPALTLFWYAGLERLIRGRAALLARGSESGGNVDEPTAEDADD